MISPLSRVVATTNQVSSSLGDEAVILSFHDGIYYGLDPLGAQIWNLVQRPHTVAEIRDAVEAKYDVDPARCESDVIALLQEMLERGLVEVVDNEVT